MYKVIKSFYDLQDVKETKNGPIYTEYKVSDTYPARVLNRPQSALQSFQEATISSTHRSLKRWRKSLRKSLKRNPQNKGVAVC